MRALGKRSGNRERRSACGSGDGWRARARVRASAPKAVFSFCVARRRDARVAVDSSDSGSSVSPRRGGEQKRRRQRLSGNNLTRGDGARPTGGMIETRVVVHCLSLLILVVQVSRPVCVEVPSETEAVLGNAMKLTCISCMKREEVNAETRVHWYYVLSDNEPIQIFQYDRQPQDLDGPWKGRLLWNGSKDLQDVSISIINVTYNDSGIYRCDVFRQFNYDFYTPSFSVRKEIKLVVREEVAEDTTALYSEIMMYVLLVFLTFWLLVEMIYCYRKISKSDEQVQDNAY